MNLLKSLLYGFVSGVSEFLPISSQGHQILFQELFGNDYVNPALQLVIRLSTLAALVLCCATTIIHFRVNLQDRVNVRRKQNFTDHAFYDLQFVKNASLPLALIMALCMVVYRPVHHPIFLGVCFLLNGLILYLPSRFIRANKNSRLMSRFDSILVGLFGALSIFPGISRIACTTSMASFRGADFRESYNWSLLIGIPVLIVLAVFDIIATVGYTGVSVGFWPCFIAAVGSLLGSLLSITLMRSLTSKTDISGFFYYSLGAAMLSIILYMIV